MFYSLGVRWRDKFLCYSLSLQAQFDRSLNDLVFAHGFGHDLAIIADMPESSLILMAH